MSLVEHAQHELALIEEDPELVANLVAVVAKFAEYGHSGGSAPFAIAYLGKLLRFEPLSPLTSNPDEWIDRTEISSEPMWQSKREPRAFSKDGGKTWYLLGEDRPRSGPEHYSEGERLLEQAQERSEALARDPMLGEMLLSDSTVQQLLALGHEHFTAAQTAVLAAALLPDSVSWQTAIGLRHQEEENSA